MEKEFNIEIKSPFFYQFELGQSGLYTLTVKALCKPGWRNKWWLKFKGIIEDILDLHLDDGKPLTVLTRATYALYRYTPHIAGSDLFYQVYNQFFGKNDLGGKI